MLLFFFTYIITKNCTNNDSVENAGNNVTFSEDIHLYQFKHHFSTISNNSFLTEFSRFVNAIVG